MAMEDEIKQLRGAVEEMTATLHVSMVNLATVTQALAERIATPAAEAAAKPQDVVAKPKKAKAKTKPKTEPEAEKEDTKVTPISEAKKSTRDIEEVRTEARDSLTLIIRSNKRDVAQALVRRVAGDKKLPEIESADDLEKLAKLALEYIQENDLATAG